MDKCVVCSSMKKACHNFGQPEATPSSSRIQLSAPSSSQASLSPSSRHLSQTSHQSGPAIARNMPPPSHPGSSTRHNLLPSALDMPPPSHPGRSTRRNLIPSALDMPPPSHPGLSTRRNLLPSALDMPPSSLPGPSTGRNVLPSALDMPSHYVSDPRLGFPAHDASNVDPRYRAAYMDYSNETQANVLDHMSRQFATEAEFRRRLSSLPQTGLQSMFNELSTFLMLIFPLHNRRIG
jgi:hypothetical protein